jgi:nitroreductase
VDKLNTLVADHSEQRLVPPARLERILSSVLDRRKERIERRTARIAEFRKLFAEENCVTLLRAEGLDTLPENLADRIQAWAQA